MNGRECGRSGETRKPSAASATLIVMMADDLEDYGGLPESSSRRPRLRQYHAHDGTRSGSLHQLLIGGAIGAVLTPTLAGGIARNQERRTAQYQYLYQCLLM